MVGLWAGELAKTQPGPPKESPEARFGPDKWGKKEAQNGWIVVIPQTLCRLMVA
jgi:hypothetical protein